MSIFFEEQHNVTTWSCLLGVRLVVAVVVINYYSFLLPTPLFFALMIAFVSSTFNDHSSSETNLTLKTPTMLKSTRYYLKLNQFPPCPSPLRMIASHHSINN